MNNSISQSIKDEDDTPSMIWPRPSSNLSFNPPLKLGVMSSGNGSNFESLVMATRTKLLDATVHLLVVNNPNCKAMERANRLNIPCVVIDHRKYSSREQLDLEIIKHFKAYDIEGIIMAGWMRIVSDTLINTYPNRIVNIHPSLLPCFKGHDAVEQALTNRVTITGCTVHIVRKDVDSGPILIQAAVPVLLDDNKDQLLKRIQIEEHRILPIGVSLAATKWRERNLR